MIIPTNGGIPTRLEKMKATFIPILRPELKTEFLSIWQDWFVLEDTIRDEKTPGKLKG